MKSIPRRLIDERTYLVNYLVYSNENGVREYLYIAVRKDKMPEFQQAVKRGNFDAEEYGIILDHGKGEAPDDVKEKMKMLYKCDHENGVSIRDYNPEPG